MNLATKPMLEVIANAGFVVTAEPGPEGRVVFTATDATGATWTVAGFDEYGVATELAEQLGVHDMD